MIDREQFKFDPHAWSQIYESGDARGQDFVFARSAEIAAEVCKECFPADAILLDAGCGTGHLAMTLASRGAHAIAMDYDQKMLNFARQRTAQARLRFIAGDVRSLPLADESCDGAVAVSLAGCLPDLGAMLKELHRVLRPRGIAIVTFTNRRSLLLRASALINRVIGRTDSYSDRFAYHLYEIDESTAAIQAAGFEIVDERFYNVFLTLGRRMLPSKRLALKFESRGGRAGFIHSHLARNFVLIARKKRTPELLTPGLSSIFDK